MTSDGPADDAWRTVAALAARITAQTAPPTAFEIAVAAGVALLVVLFPRSWHLARHGITIVHEAGHGAVATLTGRRLAGIRLHSDTSGVTVSVGRRRGPGMIATLAAGYPAASATGVLAAWAIGAGHAAAALWGALAVLALVLVQIRNWFGLWTVLASAALVGAATWLLDAAWQGAIATGLTALLLFGGLRTAIELQSARRREARSRTRAATSDADQLAALTGVPGIVWVGVFVLAAAAAIAAAWLLLGIPHLLAGPAR